MGTRNDDISLILAKAKKQGFLPDVKDSEVDILSTEAKSMFQSDTSIANISLAGRLGNMFAAAGDSITAVNSDNTYKAWGDSWVTHLALSSKGTLNLVANGGHGGWTSTQLEAVFNDEIVALKPNVVHIAAGTNDNLDGNNRCTATAAALTSMVEKAKTAGIVPVLHTIPPASSAAISSPSAPTFIQDTTGGTLGAGTYSYRISAVTGTGETLAGTAATTVVASGTTNCINVGWTMVDGAQKYKIYGRTGGSELLLATVQPSGAEAFGVSFWKDTGAVTPAGALPASNTTAVAYNATADRKITTINAWIRQFCVSNKVHCVDVYSILVDTTTGMYITGYTFDGTHPTPKTQQKIGKFVWDKMATYYNPVSVPITYSNVDPVNVVSNGCLVNGSANLPTGWSSYWGLSSAFTDTLAVRTGFAGKALGVSREYPDPRFHELGGIGTQGVTWDIGDVIDVSWRVETVGLAASGAVSSTGFKAQGTNINLVSLRLSGLDVEPSTMSGTFTIPAGTTGLLFFHYISGANSTGTAYVGQITVYNRTKNGYIS